MPMLIYNPANYSPERPKLSDRWVTEHQLRFKYGWQEGQDDTNSAADVFPEPEPGVRSHSVAVFERIPAPAPPQHTQPQQTQEQQSAHSHAGAAAPPLRAGTERHVQPAVTTATQQPQTTATGARARLSALTVAGPALLSPRSPPAPLRNSITAAQHPSTATTATPTAGPTTEQLQQRESLHSQRERGATPRKSSRCEQQPQQQPSSPTTSPPCRPPFFMYGRGSKQHRSHNAHANTGSSHRPSSRTAVSRLSPRGAGSEAPTTPESDLHNLSQGSTSSGGPDTPPHPVVRNAAVGLVPELKGLPPSLGPGCAGSGSGEPHTAHYCPTCNAWLTSATPAEAATPPQTPPQLAGKLRIESAATGPGPVINFYASPCACNCQCGEKPKPGAAEKSEPQPQQQQPPEVAPVIKGNGRVLPPEIRALSPADRRNPRRYQAMHPSLTRYIPTAGKATVSTSAIGVRQCLYAFD